MVDDCLVVLLAVLTAKMISEIRIRGLPPIEIIGYPLRGNVGAISLPASLLEAGVEIRNAVLTCMSCRLSSGFFFPLPRLEV